MIRLAKAEEVRTWGFLAGFKKESAAWGKGDNREYAVKQVEDLITSGKGAVLLSVDEDGKVQGGLCALKGRDRHDGTLYAVEDFFFVHPAYRDQGIGAILINAFEAWAASQGCRKAAMIHLVDSYPDILKAFYEKRGYKLTELHYVKDLA
jgi:GNAT superfamily N-acetyltransferase